MQDLPYPVRAVLLHFVGWFRWTQILPMLVVWGSVWAILAAFIFVNFQGETITAVSALGQLAERVGWEPNFNFSDSTATDGSFGAQDGVAGLGRTGEDGALLFDESDVKKIIVAYWGSVSLGLYLVSLIWQRIVGPRPPMSLRRRLMVAGGLAIATWVCFVTVYATTSQQVHGSLATWLLVFTVLCALPMGASVYALTVAWVADLTSAALRAEPGLAPLPPERVHEVHER